MNILTNLSAVGGLLNGAAGLVREFKQPKLSGDDFAKLLEIQLAQANSTQAAQEKREQRVEWVNAMTQRFTEQRDANGDGMLTRDESGLAEEVFARFDVDGDGMLTLEELRKPLLKSNAAE